MAKPTVLFVCPDNALLGPLAEACLNARGGGLIRAFSAGFRPAPSLHKHVSRLLAEYGISSTGLSPKPIDVFLMPHAVVPDRIVYLADLMPIDQPSIWKGTTSSHWWSIAPQSALADDFSMCTIYMRRIWRAVDGLIDPSFDYDLSTGNKVA